MVDRHTAVLVDKHHQIRVKLGRFGVLIGALRRILFEHGAGHIWRRFPKTCIRKSDQLAGEVTKQKYNTEFQSAGAPHRYSSRRMEWSAVALARIVDALLTTLMTPCLPRTDSGIFGTTRDRDVCVWFGAL